MKQKGSIGSRGNNEKVIFRILLLVFFSLCTAAAQTSTGDSIDTGDTTILPEPLGAESSSDEKRIEIIIEDDRDEYTQAELQDKFQKYSHMRQAGTNLLAVGIPMLAGGLVMYISGLAMLSSYDYDITVSGAVLAMFGTIMIGVGPEFIAAGAVLRTIGGNKKREYERRLRVRVGGNSLSLLYDF